MKQDNATPSLNKALSSPSTGVTKTPGNYPTITSINSPWMTWAVNVLQKSLPESMKTALVESLKASQEDVSGAKHDAVKRLRMVLMSDRTQITPDTIATMREEILAVITKHIEVDQDTLDLQLEQENNHISLVANIAVVRERLKTADASTTEAKPVAKKASKATTAATEKDDTTTTSTQLETAVDKKNDDFIDDLLASSTNSDAEATEAG